MKTMNGEPPVTWPPFSSVSPCRMGRVILGLEDEIGWIGETGTMGAHAGYEILCEPTEKHTYRVESAFA